MQTKAIVTETNSTYATVEVERISACEGCHKATDGGCSVCSLMGSDKKISAKAENSIGAEVGDLVSIESNTGRMLWLAMIIFILPLVCAIALWLIVSMFTTLVLWQGLGALLGFLGCFLVDFIYARSIKNKRCDIKIVEIIKKKD